MSTAMLYVITLNLASSIEWKGRRHALTTYITSLLRDKFIYAVAAAWAIHSPSHAGEANQLSVGSPSSERISRARSQANGMTGQFLLHYLIPGAGLRSLFYSPLIITPRDNQA